MTSGRLNVGRVAEVATSASSTDARALAVILTALSFATTLVDVARALISWALSIGVLVASEVEFVVVVVVVATDVDADIFLCCCYCGCC